LCELEWVCSHLKPNYSQIVSKFIEKCRPNNGYAVYSFYNVVSIDQSPSEASNRSAYLEFFLPLWNSKAQCHVLKRPTLKPFLIHSHPVQTFTAYTCKICLNIMLPFKCTGTNLLLPSSFPVITLYEFSHLFNEIYMATPSHLC